MNKPRLFPVVFSAFAFVLLVSAAPAKAADTIYCTDTSTAPFILDHADSDGNTQKCECHFYENLAGCWCKFKATDPSPGCRGETTKGGDLCLRSADGDTDELTACAERCNSLGYDPLTNSSGGNASVWRTDQVVFCDFTHDNDCLNANNSSSNSCKACYCKYPSTFSNKECIGKTVFHRLTAYEDHCPQICQRSGLDPDGNAVATLDQKCDYRINNGRCELHVSTNRNEACLAEGETAKKLDDAAETASQAGSPVSLPLPLSDVRVTTLIGRIVRNLLGVMGSIAFLMFVYGGVLWMTARGNEKQVEQGRGAIVWATLGIVAIFGAYAIVNLLITSLT